MPRKRNRKQTPPRKGGPSTQKPVTLTGEQILAAMTAAGRPLYLREIFHLAHIRPEDRERAKALTTELVRDGRLVLLKGHRYGLCDLMPLVNGRLSVHPDGFGFVRPEAGKGPDIFVPSKGLKGAIHGDTVVVRVEKSKKKGPEGTIIRILERKVKRVVGTFHKGRTISVVIPEDNRLLFEILIPPRFTNKARNGQAVVAEIDGFETEGRNPEGRVVDVLGDPNDMAVQTQIVIRKYDLPHEFSSEADQEANQLPDHVKASDLKGRKDLRDQPLVTIDGAQARDFDDAVCVRKTRTGFTLIVAIADVSHYVKEGHPLDEDAVERGTSTYFPNAVVPMLPEALSNNLCSLVPDEDRLSLAARLSFDREGNLRQTNFFPAVMRSCRRFTYSQVRKILVDKDRDLIAENKPHVLHLKWMAELADTLNKKRVQRGTLDFDLPEPMIILGLTGELEDIVRKERNIAHQIIEEFMIAANEAVAKYLADRAIPTLFRVHGAPDPEKLRDFVEFAQSMDIQVELPDTVTPRWAQTVLHKVAGKPAEYVVNTVLLRTLKQAVYSPENIGHFGLASPTYLHFTSPIRRYPDLVVHRILKANLRKVRKQPVYAVEQLETLGEHCSTRERVAMEAEREMLDRLKVRFLAERIGEIYDGVISSVTSFGFFVELKDVFIDGAVRLVDLADDYYEHDPSHHRLVGRRTNKIFQLGQPVRVQVKSVNIARRHINFEVV